MRRLSGWEWEIDQLYSHIFFLDLIQHTSVMPSFRFAVVLRIKSLK